VYLWKSRSLVGTAFGRWVVVVGVGMAFVPLAYLRGSPARNVALYVAAAGGFLLVLRALGTITARELGTLYQTLGFATARRKGSAEAGS
jgi:hypothetical protein